MKTAQLNLVKLNKSWFVDMPCQNLEDLRLIKETSAFVERHADGAHHIKVKVTDGDTTSARMIFTKGTTEAEGCIYNLGKAEVWFSDNLKSIFGDYPDVLSITW